MTNILLITADDMDGNTPGSFGGPKDATPNLDRLAAGEWSSTVPMSRLQSANPADPPS